MLVCSLVRVTSTPGITPPASLIDPRSTPWNPCAHRVPEAATVRNAPMSAARNLIRLASEVSGPSLGWLCGGILRVRDEPLQLHSGSGVSNVARKRQGNGAAWRPLHLFVAGNPQWPGFFASNLMVFRIIA